MRGRPFRVQWRDEDSEDALKAAYLSERDGVIRSRIQAVWLLRRGRSLSEVTAVLGVNYRSVQRWVAWYRRCGLAVIRSRHSGGVGQPPFLAPEAPAEVAREVATGRFRTGAEIRDWIRQTSGVEYTVGGIYPLLKCCAGGKRCPGRFIRAPISPRKRRGKRGRSGCPPAS